MRFCEAPLRTCAQDHAPPLWVKEGRFSLSTQGMSTSRGKARRRKEANCCTPLP